MAELIYKDKFYTIIGAAMEVHNHLGCGFLEAVYQEALECEFQGREIPFENQRELQIYYKDKLLNKTYTADFLVYNKIIIEIKASDRLTSKDESQLLNYLKATGLELGILINFGAERLEFKRMVFCKQHRQFAAGDKY